MTECYFCQWLNYIKHNQQGCTIEIRVILYALKLLSPSLQKIVLILLLTFGYTFQISSGKVDRMTRPRVVSNREQSN